MTFYGHEQALPLLWRQWPDLACHGAWWIDEGGSVLRDEAPAHRRVERSAENDPSVPPSTCGHALVFQRAQPRLHLLRCQACHWPLAQVAHDVSAEHSFVRFERPRPHPHTGHVLQPPRQKLFDCLTLIPRRIAPLQLTLSLRELVADLRPQIGRASCRERV